MSSVRIMGIGAIALALLGPVGPAAADEPNMATVLYAYTGAIDGQPLAGRARLLADQTTGHFDAKGSFTQFPSSFQPASVGFSLVSISCSNGAAATAEAPNILHLSKGTYTSSRRVRLTDDHAAEIGDIRIEGRFQRMGPAHFDGDVKVSGHYAGPMDLVMIDGYSIVMRPTAPNTLRGEVTINMTTLGGTPIQARHEQVYVFHDGVTQPLVPMVMEVRYDSAVWSPATKALELHGTSSIKPYSEP